MVPRPASPSWTRGPDVEREKLGVLPLQPRGDERAVRIDGEVHEGAPGEKQVVGVALPVLGDGVPGVLSGVRVLQLDGGDGQPVDEQREVDGLAGVAVAEVKLPRDTEDVRVVLLQRVGGEG